MRDWLLVSGCTVVAMESTGIYWRAVHAELEDYFELIVGNAQHIKNVPGRKTDVKDCEWISDLARHGADRQELRTAASDPRLARSDPLPTQALASPGGGT
jgi:transposase